MYISEQTLKYILLTGTRVPLRTVDIFLLRYSVNHVKQKKNSDKMKDFPGKGEKNKYVIFNFKKALTLSLNMAWVKSLHFFNNFQLKKKKK